MPHPLPRLRRGPAAADGCEADGTVNEWNSRFPANAGITDLGAPICARTPEGAIPGIRQIIAPRNAGTGQSGAAARAENAACNAGAGIGAGGGSSPGLQATRGGNGGGANVAGIRSGGAGTASR